LLVLHLEATGKPVAEASSERWIWVVQRGSFTIKASGNRHQVFS
jgi:hypothetical protein